uniref:Uncharacterized protein n=1 Tax=Pararge aegeria TaxID=116150 RepID=S4PYK2_9NEOP
MQTAYVIVDEFSLPNRNGCLIIFTTVVFIQVQNGSCCFRVYRSSTCERQLSSTACVNCIMARLPFALF